VHGYDHEVVPSLMKITINLVGRPSIEQVKVVKIGHDLLFGVAASFGETTQTLRIASIPLICSEHQRRFTTFVILILN